MKNIVVILAASAALSTAAQAALTVETSNFIASPTNFTGFENIGAITGGDGVTSYSEDGIAVDYIGTDGAIWSYSANRVDQYSWYPDGGGNGYTRITFADATAIQFLAGSGFGSVTNLAYEVLLDGNLVGTGVAGSVPAYGTMTWYGFSGATFDEVRLQAATGFTAFDPTAFEAMAIDSISIGNGTAVVPEPASWAMLIAGFGLTGAAMRRRSTAVAA